MKKPVFYGWWVVAAAFGVIFVNAGIGFYSLGIFLKPLVEEFGWGRAQTSLGGSLAALMAGFTAIVIGRLVEKYGARKIVFTGAVVGAGLFFLLTTVNTLWQFYLIYAINGIFLGACAGFMPVLIAVSNWFVKKQGRAIGIATSGMALGALVLAPLIGMVVADYGWRGGAIFNALVILAVDVPLALFLLVDKPENKSLLPDNEPATASAPTNALERSAHVLSKGKSYQLNVHLKSPVIWLISFSLFVGVAAAVGMVFHEVPYLTDIGISPTLAASILGITGALGAIGNITLGILAERISVRHVIALACAIQALGILILIRAADNMGMVWTFVGIFGFAFGTFPLFIPLMVRDLFPKDAFSSVYGFINFLYQIGIFVGPPLAGLIYDSTSSYAMAFIMFIGMFILSIALVYLAWGRKSKVLSLY